MGSAWKKKQFKTCTGEKIIYGEMGEKSQLVSETGTVIRNTQLRLFLPKVAMPSNSAKDIFAFSTEGNKSVDLC